MVALATSVQRSNPADVNTLVAHIPHCDRLLLFLFRRALVVDVFVQRRAITVPRTENVKGGRLSWLAEIKDARHLAFEISAVIPQKALIVFARVRRLWYDRIQV